jgi:molecular chaperone HtpG
MSKTSFSINSAEMLRRMIQDIESSYHHHWDILAELCQNSVDALELSEKEEKNISIQINSSNRSISIFDNGIGIEPEQLTNLLLPFSTNKKEDEATIGEKGVGLVFVSFQCNNFEIHTSHKNGKKAARIKDAASWKTSLNNELPEIEEISFYRDWNETGTEVIIENTENLGFYDLSIEQLEFLLRTKTAIGNTKTLFGEIDENINVSLTKTSASNHTESKDVAFKFYSPTELINDQSKLALRK